jgi:hypothetical protein
MGNKRMTIDHDNARRGFFASRATWVLLAFLAIAGFALFTEHRAHALGVLPWLLLLACPLLHVFMHGGHGGHARRDASDDPRATPPQQH